MCVCVCVFYIYLLYIVYERKFNQLSINLRRANKNNAAINRA